jgi:hypothetical protein
MPTPSKNAKTTDADRISRSPGRSRLLKRHAAPTSPGEKHIGATEDQVAVTMPPKADDDEPKQG